MKMWRILLIFGVILSVMFAGISLSLTTARNDMAGEETGQPSMMRKGPPPALVDVSQARLTSWNSEKQVLATVKSKHYLNVLAEVSGTITQVAPAGSRVASGEALFHLDSRAEVAELKEKEANLKLTQLNAARADSLASTHSVSKADQQSAHVDFAKAVSDLESLRNTLRKMMVNAPFPGLVSLHDLEVGQSVLSGEKLFSFYDPDHLYVEFSVPEQDVRFLHQGMTVQVKDNLSGYVGKATISLIGTEVDTESRTLTLRAALENGNFRYGSSVRVTYPSSESKMSLVVPRMAINYSAYGQSVFVVKNNHVELRSVITGDSYDGLVQIEQGLKENDIVVTAGQIRLYPNAPVRVGESQ
ncbi:Efflux pump periplasmic linker BepD precursor [Vibrio ruber DSM 16370]|uniref:Efflux pump periplasmic linker BepD n=1 Tax=Vibrio ruber (strain DSM 16370 / JCM 11486 / BCRC 17186 / CECT 7878 / LMG 23124 / VR1) TaxID=1123498 RepID=A0A1R4LDJ0_VIBR1|nr:efflux RND transporter periplasmic adaptor subunit [Vibrio ruber]SJN54641.1 Efflux pump periplasmic linker BepD precursor [Vibrio ruber DSM 16370]